LHDRLRSRFEWGLLADIQPPDLEHQRASVHAKAEALGVHLPDEALAAIARPECGSVRELEGALNRVVALAALVHQPVDRALVERALGPLRPEAPHEVTSHEVMAVVTQHYGVTADALRGKARDHGVAWPRQVAMYLMREVTPCSLEQIGDYLGGRDHTTIMHGCAHVAREIRAKDHVRRDLDDLLARCRA
jgi:chromosomal replication initiator protein